MNEFYRIHTQRKATIQSNISRDGQGWGPLYTRQSQIFDLSLSLEWRSLNICEVLIHREIYFNKVIINQDDIINYYISILL